MKTYTTDEAAARLGIKPDTVRRLIARKLLTATKRGRDWFITEAEIIRYRQERKRAGRPGKGE